MSEDRTTVADAATEILRDLSTPDDVRRCEGDGWNEELWSVLAGSGFTLVSVPETAGGSGGDLADMCAVLTAVGRHAAAVPIAETAVLAGWAAAAAGLEVGDGPATTPVGHPDDDLSVETDGDGWRVSGTWHRVPWARQAHRLVVLAPQDAGHRVLVLPVDGLTVSPGHNLAGESRDTVRADGVVAVAGATAPTGVDPAALRLRGALARACTTAGALDRMSALTVGYTGEREQFGRALARFQAVQRHVVRLAEHAQLAGVAAECAAVNAGDGEPDPFDVATAKIIAAEAATEGARAAHQAHGAIGMTKEYELGQHSRRAWAWRDEFGGDLAWSRFLGDRLADAGASELWPRLSVGTTVATP